jgi:hypothetical protein
VIPLQAGRGDDAELAIIGWRAEQEGAAAVVGKEVAAAFDRSEIAHCQWLRGWWLNRIVARLKDAVKPNLVMPMRSAIWPSLRPLCRSRMISLMRSGVHVRVSYLRLPAVMRRVLLIRFVVGNYGSGDLARDTAGSV